MKSEQDSEDSDVEQEEQENNRPPVSRKRFREMKGHTKTIRLMNMLI